MEGAEPSAPALQEANHGRQESEEGHHCGRTRICWALSGPSGSRPSKLVDNPLPHEETKTIQIGKTKTLNNLIQLEDTVSRRRSKHEGEPSAYICDRLCRTRVSSQRQLPTDHDYAVPTREYQLDQSSPLPATAAADLALDRKKRPSHLDRSPHINVRIARDTASAGSNNAISWMWAPVQRFIPVSLPRALALSLYYRSPSSSSTVPTTTTTAPPGLRTSGVRCRRRRG